MVDAKTSGARGGRRAAHNRKLTDDQVRAIRRLLKAAKEPKAGIARLFGVSVHTIRGISQGFNYSQVE